MLGLAGTILQPPSLLQKHSPPAWRAASSCSRSSPLPVHTGSQVLGSPQGADLLLSTSVSPRNRPGGPFSLWGETSAAFAGGLLQSLEGRGKL